MTDYASMTDEQLNAAVAKRQGYTAKLNHVVIAADAYVREPGESAELVVKAGEYDVWVISTPEGKELNPVSEFVEHVYSYSKPYESEAEAFNSEACRFWATSTPVALKLIEPDGFTINYSSDKGYEVKLDYSAAPVAVHKLLSRAATIAWLMWQDVKEVVKQPE